MKTTLKKTLLAVVPLAGLLLTAPAAFAHPRHHQWDPGAHCRPDSNQGWHNGQRSYDNDYNYRRGWYNDRRWNDDDYRSRYQRPFYPDRRWYRSNYR